MQVARFPNPLVTLVSTAIALAAVSLVACQQAQPPAATPAASKPATTEIFVTFEGPWVIVADPKNDGSIIAIAPKTKSHAPLAVVPANIHLDAGVYDLPISSSGEVGSPAIDKGILQAHVDANAVQRALDNKGLYAVRLPKPAAYVAETRFVSRVGNTYPPAASSEQDYASAISLRYNVSNTSGFQLAGTQDTGSAIKPLLLDLNTRFVRFTIDPIQVPLSDEPCHLHARQAFHDAMRLVALTMYVDFPDSPADCRKKDPQATHSDKAQSLPGSPVRSTAGPSGGALTSAQQASMSAGGLAVLMFSARILHQLQAALYFFHSEGGACFAPMILGI